ncbi:MAG: GxxExxY protein [Terriglobales bacterium]
MNTFEPQRTQRQELDLKELTHCVINAAMKVHSALGPGLLESAYEACLAHELKKIGLRVSLKSQSWLNAW